MTPVEERIDHDPEEIRKRIWSEPLTENERGIILGIAKRKDGLQALLWMRHLLEVYDGYTSKLLTEHSALEETLRDLFRIEPYTGVRNPLCPRCQGKTMVSGENHDDPRWLPCLSCDGTGLAEHVREALALPATESAQEADRIAAHYSHSVESDDD